LAYTTKHTLNNLTMQLKWKLAALSIGLTLAFTACGDEDGADDGNGSVDCTANAPLVNTSVTNTTCGTNTGTITVTANGGQGPYEYSLNGGTLQESPEFTELVGGQYEVLIRDANGCEGSTTVTVNEDVDFRFTVSNPTQATCGGTTGVLMVNVNGTGTYQYSLDGAGFVSSNMFMNLAPGDYTVAVRNENDCEATLTLTLESNVSWAQQIKPIIDANCAVSGCHVAGTGRINFTEFANVQNNASAIKNRTAGGNMPPSSRPDLTSTQIELIGCWVDDGAQEN